MSIWKYEKWVLHWHTFDIRFDVMIAKVCHTTPHVSYEASWIFVDLLIGGILECEIAVCNFCFDLLRNDLTWFWLDMLTKDLIDIITILLHGPISSINISDSDHKTYDMNAINDNYSSTSSWNCSACILYTHLVYQMRKVPWNEHCEIWDVSAPLAYIWH
jgi:hypothetical protein